MFAEEAVESYVHEHGSLRLRCIGACRADTEQGDGIALFGYGPTDIRQLE